MVMYRCAASCLALVTLAATNAFAQPCLGTASFGSGPARIGAGVDVGPDARQYAAQLSVGKPAGPFAAGTIGLVEFDEIDETGTSFAGELGFSLGVSATSPFEVCPVIGIGHLSADVGAGGFSAEISSRVLSAGLAIGGVASSTPTVAFVPAIVLAYTNENVKSEGVLELEESEDYGMVTLIAGLVFNQRVTVRPNIAFPIGLDDSDPAYGVGIGINFGTPPSSR